MSHMTQTCPGVICRPFKNYDCVQQMQHQEGGSGTHCYGIRHCMQSHFVIRVLEVAMLFPDALTTQADGGRLHTVKAADLRTRRQRFSRKP